VSLDVVENVDNAVVNVDTELTPWLLYRVYILIEVSVLAMDLRQILETATEESFATARPSRVLIDDPEKARRDCSSSLLPCPAVSSSERCDEEFVCDETGGKLNPIIKFVTFVARAEPESERERESDRILGAASPTLFPKERFHLLAFFGTVEMNGTGGSGGGTSGNDWTEAEAERVWRLSSRASVWDADASNSDVWM
jgi:hypothetical protein